MNSNSRLTLSTSPLSQSARKPLGTTSLGQRRRLLYGRNQHYPTGKERDTETGLYYFGARYLDSKTSRWLSGDPAMGEYVPSAPVDDDARKRNGSLPGQGGVFNYVNLHVYHYAGNNPIKYTDPDGRFSLVLPFPVSTPWIGTLPKIIPFPWIGTVVPPVIVTPPPLPSSALDDPGIDMGDTNTWPKPPVEGPVTEGEPSRDGPRKRGEKSLFDKDGGEWRPHKPDKFHPRGHWNYKPPSTPGNRFPKWEKIDPSGQKPPETRPRPKTSLPDEPMA